MHVCVYVHVCGCVKETLEGVTDAYFVGWRGEDLEDCFVFEITGPWARLVSLSFLGFGQYVLKWKMYAFGMKSEFKIQLCGLLAG